MPFTTQRILSATCNEAGTFQQMAIKISLRNMSQQQYTVHSYNAGILKCFFSN
jgi:hypothetical protein